MNMHPILLWLTLLAALHLRAVEPSEQAPLPPPPPTTLAELQERLTAHVSQAKYAGALWGVKVVSLSSGKTVFEHNAQKLLSPASNSKLYTVALALDRLGRDYQIKTSLYAQKQPDEHGRLAGDLVIFGRGDPTINARLNGGDLFKALQPFVNALTNAGVKRIEGDLVGDDSFFHGPEFGSGWTWDDAQYYYGAEISALTINDNIMQVLVKPGGQAGLPCEISVFPSIPWFSFSNQTTTASENLDRKMSLYRPMGGNVVFVTGRLPLGDSGYKEDMTVHDPAAVFATVFKEALRRSGIDVGGTARSVHWQERQAVPLDLEKLVELGFAESLPMREIAREVQKPSQNLYTDLLLAHVGERARNANTVADETAEELGIRELSKFLAEAGVKKGEVFFEEGSGLSRNNLTTPNATVGLLQYMSKHRWADAYLAALPVAGVDGTLRNRMKDTPAAANVRAKTGTLRWANSLSGHVTTAGGERLIFSIMLNRYYSPGGSTRADIDAIAILLASYAGKDLGI
jgi:serine-type D-Ala-D-Ala carboxypeptidase/endopeptidase (penicillin-binding protein 4)